MKFLIGAISFLCCISMVSGEKRAFFCTKRKKRLSFSSKEVYHDFGLYCYCKKYVNKEGWQYSTPKTASRAELQTGKIFKDIPLKNVVADEVDDIYADDIVELWEDKTSSSGIAGAIESLLSFFIIE